MMTRTLLNIAGVGLIMSIMISASACDKPKQANNDSVKWRAISETLTVLDGLDQLTGAFTPESLSLLEDGSVAVAGMTGVEAAMLAYPSSGHECPAESIVILKVGIQGDAEVLGCYGGSDMDSISAIAASVDGSLVIAGHTTSSTDFMRAHGVLCEVKGFSDLFAAYLDASGGVRWLTCLGGVGIEQINDMCLVPDGGTVMCGSIASSDVPYGWNQDIDKDAISLTKNALVVSLDQLGNAEWGWVFGRSQFDKADAVCADASGYSYVVGGTLSEDFPGTVLDMSAHDGLPGSGKAPESEESIFIAKFDKMGERLWSTRFGGSGMEVAADVAIRKNGTLVVVGASTSHDLRDSFPEDPPLSNGSTSSSNRDAFAAMFTNDGDLMWYRRLVGSDYAVAVIVTPEDRILVLSDVKSGNVPRQQAVLKGQESESDLVVTLLDESGAILHSERATIPGEQIPVDLAHSASGDTYILGMTRNSDETFRPTRGGRWVMRTPLLIRYRPEGALHDE